MIAESSRARLRSTKPGSCSDKADVDCSPALELVVDVLFNRRLDASSFTPLLAGGVFALASLNAASTTPKNSKATLKTFRLLYSPPFHMYPTAMLATGPALLSIICNGREILYPNAALLRTFITTNCAAKMPHCLKGTLRFLIRGNHTVCVGCSGGGHGGDVTVNVSCDGSVYSVIAMNCSRVISVPVEEESVSIDSRV